MPFEIVRNDITKMHVDAIVNTANSSLRAGGGVCGAIFEAAGVKELQKECDLIGYCRTGEAVITSGCGLLSKYVIHTVGPVWQGGEHDEEKLLRACYRNSMELAKKYEVESMAFPLISSGTFRYPKDQALSVATSEIQAFLLHNDMMIYLVVFSRDAFSLSERLYKSISRFIDDNYVRTHNYSRSRREAETTYQINQMKNEFRRREYEITPRDINEAIKNVKETFSQMLLRLINASGKTDCDIYKRANIDRKLFSKIRNNPNYRPGKNTVLAFAVALELSLKQTSDLLSRAGYALSPSSRFDLIVEYFIQQGNYNIFKINEALFAFNESILGV